MAARTANPGGAVRGLEVSVTMPCLHRTSSSVELPTTKRRSSAGARHELAVPKPRRTRALGTRLDSRHAERHPRRFWPLQLALPQHFLYFLPLPHVHGSLRPTLG